MEKEKFLTWIEKDYNNFLNGATEAKKFIEITQQIIQEESNKLIDASSVKRGEDWGTLSNQVVGAECF